VPGLLFLWIQDFRFRISIFIAAKHVRATAGNQQDAVEEHEAVGDIHLVGHHRHGRQLLQVVQPSQDLLRLEFGALQVDHSAFLATLSMADANQKFHHSPTAPDESAEPVAGE